MESNQDIIVGVELLARLRAVTSGLAHGHDLEASKVRGGREKEAASVYGDLGRANTS